MAIKTAIQHLQALDKEVKKRAVTNIIKQRGVRELLSEFICASDAINYTMRWPHTPEGHTYWMDICDKLRENGN
jgi:nitric oxide reductase large subunit